MRNKELYSITLVLFFLIVMVSGITGIDDLSLDDRGITTAKNTSLLSRFMIGGFGLCGIVYVDLSLKKKKIPATLVAHLGMLLLEFNYLYESLILIFSEKEINVIYLAALPALILMHVFLGMRGFFFEAFEGPPKGSNGNGTDLRGI